MGTFNVTCALSGLPILENDPVKVLVGVKTNFSEEGDVQPIPLSFDATYDGYGGFHNHSTNLIKHDQHLSDLKVLETLALKNFRSYKKKTYHFDIHQMSPIIDTNHPNEMISEKIFFHSSVVDKVMRLYDFEGKNLYSILSLSYQYMAKISEILKIDNHRKPSFSMLSDTLHDHMVQNMDINDDMQWFLLRIAPKRNHVLPIYNIINHLHDSLEDGDVAGASLIFESHVTTQFLILIMKQARRHWVMEGYNTSQNCDLDLAESICHATFDEIKRLREKVELP